MLMKIESLAKEGTMFQEMKYGTEKQTGKDTLVKWMNEMEETGDAELFKKKKKDGMYKT